MSASYRSRFLRVLAILGLLFASLAFSSVFQAAGVAGFAAASEGGESLEGMDFDEDTCFVMLATALVPAWPMTNFGAIVLMVHPASLQPAFSPPR